MPGRVRRRVGLAALKLAGLTQALLLLPLTGVALRWFGFRPWQAILNGWLPAGPGPTSAQDPLPGRVRATTTGVRAAARLVCGRDACLQRSLVLWWLLRRQGVACDLHIGVRREAGRLRAHAWVEWLGRVVNDADHVRSEYLPFDRAILPTPTVQL